MNSPNKDNHFGLGSPRQSQLNTKQNKIEI